MNDAKHIIPRDEAYLAFIREQPCEVCGKGPCVPAHGPGRKGTAMKSSDYTCLPLCGHCHGIQHQKGALTFAEMHGLNYYETAFRYLHRFVAGVPV